MSKQFAISVKEKDSWRSKFVHGFCVDYFSDCCALILSDLFHSICWIGTWKKGTMYFGKLQNGWLFAVAVRAFVFVGGRNSINHTTIGLINLCLISWLLEEWDRSNLAPLTRFSQKINSRPLIYKYISYGNLYMIIFFLLKTVKCMAWSKKVCNCDSERPCVASSIRLE